MILRILPCRICIIALVFYLSGCSRQTVVTKYSVYPTQSSFENCQYLLTTSAISENGKSYSDCTDKELGVWIRAGLSEQTVLERKYRCMAGDIDWNVVWDNAGQRVSVELIDVVRGTNSGRSLMLFTYEKDQKTGIFSEVLNDVLINKPLLPIGQ